MSMNTALRNRQADSIASAIATGTLTIYDGTPPADSNTSLSGNTALAAHTLADFLAATNGSAVANAVADVIIGGSGTNTATFCRITLGGFTIQLAVGLSAAPVILSSLSYTAGGNSIVNSVTITQPA